MNTKGNPRNCYCSNKKETSFFSGEQKNKRDIPEGYCGICEVCGRPGHIRHHPGSPSTGEWCDFHYNLIATLHPYSRIGCFIWLAVILLCTLSAIWFFLQRRH